MDRPKITPPDIAALQALPPVRVDLDASSAFLLLGILQLALRHPAVPPNASQFVRSLARYLQAYLSVTPNLSAICEAGWNPHADFPAGTPPPVINTTPKP